jgi:hypothetical protein
MSNTGRACLGVTTLIGGTLLLIAPLDAAASSGADATAAAAPTDAATASPTSTTDVPASSAVATSTSSPGAQPVGTNPANPRIFTVGDIEIPPGEPGQLSVVLAGRLNDSGYLPIVVRNNRDDTVYDINIVLRGSDASGAEVTVADYFIPTAGVSPGGWTFGQNGVAAPGLEEATNIQLQFSASAEPGDFVGLDVAAAELQGDAIVGTVVNDSGVVLGNFNMVSVACFDGTLVTAYEMATAEPLRGQLGLGESAHFGTTSPIDPTTCTSFAVYAVGLPAS